MKKLFELTFKGPKDIKMNEENLEIIKKTVTKSIKETIGEDKYEDLAFQCNCIKIVHPETQDSMILVKVYGWPKNEIEETNFFLNAEPSETDIFAGIKTFDENQIEKEYNQLSKRADLLKAQLNKVNAGIDELLDIGINEETTAKIRVFAKRKKAIEQNLSDVEKKLEYLKSEFYIED